MSKPPLERLDTDFLRSALDLFRGNAIVAKMTENYNTPEGNTITFVVTMLDKPPELSEEEGLEQAMLWCAERLETVRKRT